VRETKECRKVKGEIGKMGRRYRTKCKKKRERIVEKGRVYRA
jgi:hypothetical protein